MNQEDILDSGGRMVFAREGAGKNVWKVEEVPSVVLDGCWIWW